MTLQEAQLLLDSMLMPLSKHKRRIQANNTLSEGEKDLLLQIVIDVKAQKKAYDYDKALLDISQIMKRYSVKATSKTKNGNSIVIRPNSLPFLIHQILFFIAVECVSYKVGITQKYIINELNNNGVPISHNFFSRMHTTPTQYISMDEYEQPELVTKYKGQKHGELSVAIKNLVYQAGKYDIFCDIFGGSGAALLSVDRRNEANYVYNELNRSVRNLFEVLVDDKKHLELIEELEALRKDLRGDGPWLENVNFEQEIRQIAYRNNKIIPQHKEVALDGLSEFEFLHNNIIEWIQKIRADIVDRPDSFVFKYKEKEYGKQELLDTIDLSQFKYRGNTEFLSFCYNKDLLIDYCYENDRGYLISYLQGNYYSECYGKNFIKNVGDTSKFFRQYRFYGYYAYFDNLRKRTSISSSGQNNIATKDMVRYAVAEIYNLSFLTEASTGVSPILRLTYGKGGAKTGSKDDEKFLKREFASNIKNIHKTAKGTICEGLDCIDVIKKYQHSSQATVVKHNNPIFYSDSPYIGTSGYESKANGVSKFTLKKMNALIVALENSKDRFIFSCRAAKGSINGSQKTDELIEGNDQIKKSVFECFQDEFIEKGASLWILAIEKGGSLVELIKNNKIAEIMITNFEIHDFSSDKKSCKNVTFKVYTFEEFMQIMTDNLNV